MRPYLVLGLAGLVGCAALSGLDDFRTEASGGGGAATSTSTSTSTSTGTGTGGEQGVGGTGGSGGSEPSCASLCPGFRCDEEQACDHWASCVELRDAGAPTGKYEIDPGDGVIDVYCDNDADLGGWALLLKADGGESTFEFDASIWEDATLLNEQANDPTEVEAKLPAFVELDVQELRIVMATGGQVSAVSTAIQASPARPLMEWLGQGHTNTDIGRTEWLTMVPNGALQSSCNRNGLNVLINNSCCAKARIGLAANNENQCSSPDSAIGVGLKDIFVVCNPGPNSEPTATVGLIWADCGPEERDIASFAYVYGR